MTMSLTQQIITIAAAALGMLAVFGFKDVSFATGNHGLPEIISLVVIILLHRLKKNMLLSDVKSATQLHTRFSVSDNQRAEEQERGG